METDLTAANGKKVKALEIFAYALQFFKEQALKVGYCFLIWIFCIYNWYKCELNTSNLAKL